MRLADYLISVVVMSAILGFVAYASYPDSASKATKFAASVLILYVAVMPIGELISGFRNGGFDTSELIGSVPEINEGGEYVEVAEKAFKEGISKLLFTEYGIKPENASIKTEGFDFKTMRCAKMKITLYDRGALADFRGIEEYISESGLGECEVYLSIG